MKTLITTALSLALLVLPLQAQTTNAPPADKGFALACFVLVVGCTGAYIIWHVKGCFPEKQNLTLVLEKTADPFQGPWVPIRTNTVTDLTDQEWKEMFRETICEIRVREPQAFFRAVLAK